MLLESSGAGAEIDLGRIPRPDLAKLNIPFSQWVRMYPGMGFIMTAKAENTAEVIELFKAVGMTAADIGCVNESRSLTIKYNSEESSVFDLAKDSITGIFKQ